MIRKLATCALAILVSAGVAVAHVTVRPRESKAGATETYVMRVPMEGQVATTSVELEVPDGVVIVERQRLKCGSEESLRSRDRYHVEG